MRIFYRISDRSYPKQKLPGTDKFVCLENFLQVFQARRDEITLICDNCEQSTLARLASYNLDTAITNKGNAGSMRLAIDTSIMNYSAETLLYFVEDDYLHREGALNALMEADDAEFADYLTLYDHPDKYSQEYGGGEESQVRRVGWQHWRYTQSTTMTFACRVWTIMKDREVWLRHIGGDHPNDHQAFTSLKQAGRRLACSIPGMACHVDLTWGLERGNFAIDPWAMEMMAGKTQTPG